MKMTKFTLFIIIIALILSGCWVALPSDGPPGAQEHVGRSYKLQRDILLVSYWITPISWEVNEKNTIGSSQKVLVTLKTGEVIKILSVKSFWLPAGIEYSYRCMELNSKKTFDLDFNMLDCIGLPKNLIKDENANKSLNADCSNRGALIFIVIYIISNLLAGCFNLPAAG